MAALGTFGRIGENARAAYLNSIADPRNRVLRRSKDMQYVGNPRWIPCPSNSWTMTMTIMALGIIPGLLLGWIAFCVADISAAHPELTRRRGCRGGSCRLT